MPRLPSLLAALLLPAIPAAAFAQTAANCADRARVLDRLASAYGETRQSIGLGANNAVVEVFASRTTGTWTITVTLPSGVTCLVASGHGFERLDEELPAAAEDA